jgi:hypothetical protein
MAIIPELGVIDPMTYDDQPTQPAEFSFQRMLDEIKKLARREPAKAVAAAFGMGLLINLLPAKVLAGTVTAVGTVLIRPALLSLGVTKAMELCCQKTPKNLNS